MKMTPNQENDIKSMLKKKCAAADLPDMCWRTPLGIVCLFINGRIITNPQLAWQIYKEERANRTVPIEQFYNWVNDLAYPSLPTIRDILSLCSGRDVSVQEMGRMAAAVTDWKTANQEG